MMSWGHDMARLPRVLPVDFSQVSEIERLVLDVKSANAGLKSKTFTFDMPMPRLAGLYKQALS